MNVKMSPGFHFLQRDLEGKQSRYVCCDVVMSNVLCDVGYNISIYTTVLDLEG
jgi:hypothetical protein